MASCTVNLFGRVEFGHIFSIICKPLADCKNFKINFTDGGVEIPFTIFVNARLKEIVMSSFLNSEWRESVKVKIGQIDSFVPGTSFKFYILASEKKFHVAFNEQHLSDFSYHTSVESIRSVQISGDLERITQVDHRRAFPSAWPPIQEDFETVSFSSDVPFEFSPGSLIVLKMRVTGAPNGSFFIRFNERGTKKQLFQFNPRFANRTVVVNTMTDSLKWLKDEKRFNDFPFLLNRQFQLAIAMTSSRFKVAVDGKHLLSYDFKMMQQKPLTAYSHCHPVFEVLTGFKIFALQGMKLSVSNVDHFQLQEDCELYENFTHPRYA